MSAMFVCMYIRMHVCMHIEWNLSIEDTIGTQLAVLYREVSLHQRQICTLLYVARAADTVLISEVSLIRSVLYREVRCIHVCTMRYTLSYTIPCSQCGNWRGACAMECVSGSS